MLPPVIVNISRLHRETAAVIEQAERSDCPVFVTQYAHVAAVLLPRRMYDRLLRAADKGARAKGTATSAAGGSDTDSAGDQDSWTTVASPLEGPLAVFGPLPPHTKFLSKYGFPVDAELAAFSWR
jgi:prevent-host-death family protein